MRRRTNESRTDILIFRISCLHPFPQLVFVSQGVNVSTAGAEAPVIAQAADGMVETPKLLTPAEFAEKSSKGLRSYRPQQQPQQQQQATRQQPQHSLPRQHDAPPPAPISVSNDQIRALVSRLAANDKFIDIVRKELSFVLGSSS